MMNEGRAKADGARVATLTRAPRDADVDTSYQHLRAKFVHQDIDEGDEDEDAEASGHHQYSSRPSTRLHTVVSAKASPSSTGTRRDVEDERTLITRMTGVTAGTGGVAELCQYTQKLEAERRDLLDQVQFLRDQDATHKAQLAAAGRRVDKLETLLQNASQMTDSQQQAQLQIEAAIAGEREKTVSMATRLEIMQRKYEDAERARQHAVFKLSELQTTMAEAATNRLLTPTHGRLQPQQRTASDAVDPTTGSNERMEKYKREIELLRQKLELREEQAHEKQKLAVELALRSAHLEHTAMLEKVKLECEIKLSEWRHEEAVRAKEVEAAMEEDRYSIRLEMKHGMQRAQIEQRVYYLQAQAALTQTPSVPSGAPGSLSGDGEVPFSAMDEVLVRMQLELLRTRRFAALKKLLQIRQSKINRAARRALDKWRTVTTQAKILQMNAVLHMNRIVKHFEKRDLRESFQSWKSHTQLVHVETQRQQAAACWNRMVAVERMVHVFQQRTVKRVSQSFHRWRLHTATLTATGNGSAALTSSISSPKQDESTGTATVSPAASTASHSTENNAAPVGAELQDEIRKLHDQLASSKSEAWRYKRQLLKQFL